MILALPEEPIVSERVTADSDFVLVECDFGTEVEVGQVFALDTGDMVTVSICSEPIPVLVIVSLEDGYTVLRPIPVEIRPIDDDAFEASFEAANIAISGHSAQDAYQSLIAEILDTFDVLEAESHLSPAAATQRATLRSYIGKP